MDATLFCCARCRATGLGKTSAGLVCPVCSAEFAIRDGVLLMMPANAASFHQPLDFDDATWRSIVTSAELPATDEHVAAFRRILSTQHQWGEIHLSAENNYYLFRNDHVRHLFDRPNTAPAATRAEPIRCRLERHRVPETMAGDFMGTWNIRITNLGSSMLSSTGERPAFVGIRWRNARGEWLVGDWPKTHLPIDLAPGRTLTLPLWVVTPPALGAVRLEVGMVDGSGRWIDEGAIGFAVHLVDRAASPAIGDWQRRHIAEAEFTSTRDHRESADFLANELARQGVRRPRVLEIGGGSDPMSRFVPDGESYSVDIDVQTMQIGHLQLRRDFPNLQFVAGDATRLPFVDAGFDAVAFVASFHHFPDPVSLLKECRRVLKPGGFVMLGAEPVGTYNHGTIHPEFKAGLEHGVNEQVFTEEEYLRIFLDAELFATRVEIHQGYSLRAILRATPEPADIRTPVTVTSPPLAAAAVPSEPAIPGLRELMRINLKWMKHQVHKRVRQVKR